MKHIRNANLPEEKNNSLISRRQFLSGAAVTGGALMFSGYVPVATSTPVDYSVFQDTMVQMAWPQIQKAIDSGAIILLPVGIIEEHGPHMGLASDIYLTYNWCKMTRQALAKNGINALIAPPLYWGISPRVSQYAGTFSISEDTFRGLLLDIHQSLKSWGARYVFNFSIHGDSQHNKVYQETIREIHNSLPLKAYYVYPGGTEVIDRECAVLIKNPAPPEKLKGLTEVHAGAFETAEILTYFPEQVNTDIARDLKPTTSFSPDGYWGEPAHYIDFPPEVVRQWAEAITTNTVTAIQQVLQTSG